MHLAPRDLDKLVLHGAGVIAQKRLARGLRLNYPEAVALIATQILELIRDGRSVADLMDAGRRMLGRAHVMDGVAEMIVEVQVEGTFPDGTKLVTVHRPIALDRVDLALALHGSFLPIPPESSFPDAGAGASPPPGEVIVVARFDRAQRGARRRSKSWSGASATGPSRSAVTIRSRRRTRRCVFDRARAEGRRLDIPAGTAVRFEPGDEKTVRLVATATPPPPEGEP